jgi:hypothetical protein
MQMSEIYMNNLWQKIYWTAPFIIISKLHAAICWKIIVSESCMTEFNLSARFMSAINYLEF